MPTPAENMMTKLEMCPFLSRIIFSSVCGGEMGTRRYNTGGSPAGRLVLSWVGVEGVEYS